MSMRCGTFSSIARIATFASFAFAIVGILSSSAHAQNIDAQKDGGLILKKTVRRVILDVVVTDANGKPVSGLAQKDFSIKEDKKKQKVLSFDVHDLTSGSDFAKLPPLPPNTFINVPSIPERGPLYVLLLDLVNTEMDDEAYARQQLLKFIKEKPAGTRFAVFVLTDKLRLAQGFTDDKDQLYSVLDPSHPKPHIPRIFLYQDNFGRNDIGMMVSVLTFIGRYLEGLPGRKNLIWFAGQFPLQLSPGDNDPVSYQDKVKTALNTLSQNQIAIYPVDIRGVVVENPHAPAGNTGGGGITSDFRTGASSAPAGGPPGFGSVGFSELANTYMNEDEIARVTGGRASYSSNDLSGALTEATEDGANYYTLTYAPTNVKYDGTLRKISVELSQKGYQLAYRRSYYAQDPDDPPFIEKSQMKQNIGRPAARKLGDSLFANMQHGAPLAHQLYFRVHIRPVGTPVLATAEQMENLEDQPAYFRVRHKNHPLKPLKPVPIQSYVIDYTVMAQTKNGDSGNALPPSLEIAAAVFDDDGQMLNATVENTVQDGAAMQTNAGGVYRAEEQLDVPQGAKSIRVAVRDRSTDRIGALEVQLPLSEEPAQPSVASEKPDRLNQK